MLRAILRAPGLHNQGSALTLNDLDAEEPDVSDLKLLPDTQSLAEKLKGCLQVGSLRLRKPGLVAMKFPLPRVDVSLAMCLDLQMSCIASSVILWCQVIDNSIIGMKCVSLLAPLIGRR